MKAFSERSDSILQLLNTSERIDWIALFLKKGIDRDDAIISYLKNIKGFIDYNDSDVFLTVKGIAFINSTSFTELRDCPKISIRAEQNVSNVQEK